MSSSQPNLAMQDVLSSIRRLVSEDLRTEPRRDHDIPATQDEAPAFSGKFVLTDALRVAEPVDSVPPQNGADHVADALDSRAEGHEIDTAEAWNDDGTAAALVQETGERNVGASLEDTIAELEAAVAGSDEAFEPDGSEVKRPDSADDGNEDVPEFSFAVDEAEGVDADLPDEIWPESPDAPTGDVRDGESSGKDVSDDFHDDDATADAANDPENAPEVEAGPAVLQATGRVRRLNFASEEEEENPHGQASEVMPTPDDFDDQAENLASGSDIGGAVHREALRELVADIIRQELQGALGERITRNVRKLVRREINRALDIEDKPETGS